MIYLKDGNIPLNLAYDDDIVQEANSTYQLSFKFPLTDKKWKELKKEVFILADDLHGEQEFFIFEVKKANGYVQVYAKQVATLLNYYSIDSISVDMVPGQTVMTALAGSTKRTCPFTFFSDILDHHTFNESNVSIMDALVKEKHSILGQWGGDLVRDKYQVKLLKNGGIENESLFMYKKNLNTYEESENINNLKTRLHLTKTIQGQTEGEADRVIAVTVDSPLINQYSQIYEADIEVNDQDVTDEASLLAYGQRYFSSTLCDLVENSINLDVKGKSDVAVKMFDTVSVYHERFDIDLRLKITSYHFAPMSKRLKSIGFGKVSQSFGSAVASMVSGSVDKATKSFEQKLQKEIDNANQYFDTEFEKQKIAINDGIEQAKADAEAYADNIKQSIDADINAVNQSMQAQSEEHDRQVADILTNAQSIEALANQAKADAASAMARANQVKTEAIADATAQVATVSQALNTAKTDLQNQVNTVDAKAQMLTADLNNSKNDILAQANAQTALTSRVTTVEATANGTKETVTQLSSTVNNLSGEVTSATQSIKTVEDSIDGVYTTLSKIQVGGGNLVAKSQLQKGYIDATGNLVVSNVHWTTPQFPVAPSITVTVPSGYIRVIEYDANKTFIRRTVSENYAEKTSRTYTFAEPTAFVAFSFDGEYANPFKIEYGAQATPWTPSVLDASMEFAEYKQTIDGQLTNLSTSYQTLNGQVSQNTAKIETTASSIREDLSSLQSYVDDEGVRRTEYLSMSELKTAELIAAERTKVARDYVAKSTYDENVSGTTLKLNEIKTTADTTKQNLATYQDTIDRKLTELTTSTQTLDGKINTASAKVDTVAGQIRTEISNVEGKIPTSIGGRNLFKGSRDFSGVWYNASNGSFFEEYKGVHIHRTKTAWLGKSQRISVKSGETYTFSFYAKSDSENDGITFYLVHSDTGTPAQGQPDNKYIAISTDYRRYSITFKITSDGIIVPRLERNNTTSSLFFGGFKLETGSISTDWSPAPEDLIDEISSVKTTINQTASGVEQLSTSLSTTNGKVTTAETKINQLISDVSSKVSQTDYNTLTGRVNSAETAITQNAAEISKRLTSTQVESVITGKGYQTKSDVDNNITGRGYITNSALQPYALATTVQNLVKETADSFSRTISETKALIPTNASSRNLATGSSNSWNDFVAITVNRNSVRSLAKISYGDETGIYANSKVNLLVYISADDIVLDSSVTPKIILQGPAYKRSDGLDAWDATYNPFHFAWQVPLKSGNNYHVIKLSKIITAEMYADFKGLELQIRIDGASSGKLHWRALTVTIGEAFPDCWSPPFEDLATVTALHNVTDTVDSHTRTIGAVGTTGSILDNVSKVTQTANGLVTEVSGANGLKTQVSTLAGSYAIKNLTSSGTVLNQLNLNKDGSVRIDGKLVQITGTTYIQDGVISSAKIADLDAGKITTGTLNAARIATNSITGSHISFDQAFFNNFMANEAYLKQVFAKNAFITQVQAVAISASKIQGGTMEATNGAMKMDFNDGQISFLQDTASIRRASSRSASQFLRFEDSGLITVPGSGIAAAHTILGSNYLGTESSGNAFSGLEIFSGKSESHSRVIGDRIEFRANQENKGIDNGNWVIDFRNREDSYFYPQKGLNTKNMFLGHMDSRITNVFVQDINLRNGQSLHDILHLLSSIAGHISRGGFSDDTYIAINDTYNNLRDKGYG